MKFNLDELVIKTGRGLLEIIKADLITSLINFVILILGLGYADVPWYGLVAFLIALVDLLPVLGAGVVLIPWAIIVLIIGNVNLAIILMVLWLITLLVNQIVQPLILGKSIGLRPIYTLGITILAMIILGPAVGAIVGSILAVVIAVILDIKNEKERERVEEMFEETYDRPKYEKTPEDDLINDFYKEDEEVIHFKSDDDDLINL